MKNTILLILILIGLSSCQSNKTKPESEILSCIHESSSDKGDGIKNKLYEFEKVLISQGFLENDSGKSYKAIFAKISNYQNVIEYSNLDGIIKSMPKMSKQELEIIYSCGNKYSWSYTHGNKELEKVLMELMQKNSSVSAVEIAEAMISNLSDEDFENDFYKLKTYQVFNAIK